MNFRKIVSLTALISFTLEILTSVVLYIMPQGRVAYWSDWQLWGLSKTQWTDQHINLGVLFLAAIIIHAWYNWPAITSYLKNRVRNLTVFTGTFNIALFLSIIFCLGTYFELPPFSTIIGISNSFKNRAAKVYGEPPYGHAELSTLKSFSKKTELDLKTSLASLRTAGITVRDAEQTLAEIARINQTTPKEIYEIIKPPESEGPVNGLPASPPSGIGRMSLSEISREYGLDPESVLKFLSEKGFAATADSTLKEIGSAYNRNPHDIYDLLAERFKTAD